MTAVAVVRPSRHDRRAVTPPATRRPAGAPWSPRAAERPAIGTARPVGRGAAASRRPAYARRRVVALLVALLVVVTAGLALRWAAAAVAGLGGAPLAASEPASSAGADRPGLVHRVQPGDTLWEVARSFQPDGDLRPLVDKLSAERRGRPLAVGERVRAP